jgi:16S rRNA (uracil1498-N3)-methyltransferase
VERRDRQVVTLFWGGASFAEGGSLVLVDDPVRHAQVRRVVTGDSIRLLDGAGRIADGLVTVLRKDEMTVSVNRVSSVPPPVPLDVLVPVADRDRMLFAAEKCVELQVTAWRPVYYARSRSVSPRGEGPKFHDKVRARMQSALEQSGGAWMPVILDEVDAIEALRDAAPGTRRFVLDMSGAPLAGLVASAPTAIAVGPEGGLEPQEFAAAAECGWTFASLGPTTLRFETAVIAAASVIRATQLTQRST